MSPLILETTPKVHSILFSVIIWTWSFDWENEETEGDCEHVAKTMMAGVGSDSETERSSVWTEDWVMSAPQPWARQISDF